MFKHVGADLMFVKNSEIESFFHLYNLNMINSFLLMIQRF